MYKAYAEHPDTAESAATVPHPEHKHCVLQKLLKIKKKLLGLMPKPAEPINLRLDIENDDFKRRAGYARNRCPKTLLVGERKETNRILRDYGLSKMCELVNRIPFVINIVNLYAEIRIDQHYINQVIRQNSKEVEVCASSEFNIEHEIEPFRDNDAEYGIDEFIRSHPLTKGNTKMTRCIGSMVKEIVTKLLRPLPLQPSFIIMDKLSDFVMYNAQFASFVRNRLQRYATDEIADEMSLPGLIREESTTAIRNRRNCRRNEPPRSSGFLDDPAMRGRA